MSALLALPTYWRIALQSTWPASSPSPVTDDSNAPNNAVRRDIADRFLEQIGRWREQDDCSHGSLGGVALLVDSDDWARHTSVFKDAKLDVCTSAIARETSL